MNPSLPELIQAHIGDRSMAQLSRDCNGAPSESRFHQIMSTGIKAFPDPVTIRNLSKGLGVSTADVVNACARSLGLHSTSADLTIPGAADLPAPAKNALLKLVSEMRNLSVTRHPVG